MLTLVSFLVAIGIIALVHELGHYMMAKKVGVGVKEFAIGFGPKIWSCKRDETEYSIRLLPIAGFVDLVGMDPNEEVEDTSSGFNHKPAPARMAVLVTGAVMNIVLAAVTFWFVFFVRGVEQPVPAHIAVALRGKPAAEAGIQAGDRIIAIDGKPIDGWFEMRTAVALHPEQAIEFTVQRGDRTFETTVTPIVTEEHNFGRIYVYPDRHYPRIGDVLKDRPAARAGFKAGDVITAVSGRPIDDWREMQTVVQKSVGQTLEMTVVRDETRLSLSVVPEAMEAPPQGWFGKLLSRLPGRKPAQKVGVIGILCNYIPPVVETVKDSSAANAAGCVPGDRFLAIAGQPVRSLNEVIGYLQEHDKTAVTGSIERNGATVEILLDLAANREIGLGIDPPLVGTVKTGSPAESANLPQDAWITRVDGRDAYSLEVLKDTLASVAPGPVKLGYRRDGLGDGTVVLDLPPPPWAEDNPLHAVGIFAPGETIWTPVAFVPSVIKSLEKTWDTAKGMLYSLYLLFSGKIRGGVKNVMGPIGIANITGKYARSGIWVLVNWIALLSTYIGLFNLLPFPALDGGRLGFLVIEVAIRRRINAKVEETVHTVGLLLLLALILLVSYFDIMRWLGF